MPTNLSTEIIKEKVILVGAISGRQTEVMVNEYLDELAFLVDTAGGEVLTRFTQKLDKPDPRSFIGSGKLDEINMYVKAEEIDLVVFDDELSPSQHRNIEKALGCRIIDRSNLILDIF